MTVGKHAISSGGTGSSVKEILDAITIGVVLLDNSGKIVFANKATEEILEEKQSSLLGKHLVSLLSEGDERLGTRREDNVFFYRKDKDRRPLKLWAVPYHDAKKKIRGKIVNLQDMTRVYKMQQEMLKMDRLAYLGELSSALAHEIRNPLAGIKTTAQALDEELSGDDPKKEYIDRIVKEIDRLNDLLRTFFSFAKPKSLDLVPYQVEHLIKEVRGLLGKEAENARVTVKEKYAAALPPVWMDVTQMKQVLINLFLNALQAMPAGGQVGIEADGANSAKGWVQIRMQDTGEGISPEHLSTIFDPFFTTKSKGLGLGLSISQKIVEGHGGSIEVESSTGQGSIFIINLPVVHARGNRT